MSVLDSYQQPTFLERVSAYFDRPDHNGRVFYDRFLSACLLTIGMIIFGCGGMWGFFLMMTGAHSFGAALAQADTTTGAVAATLSSGVFVVGVGFVIFSILAASIVLTLERIFFHVSRR